MRTETVEKWVWILIYAGLFAVAVGLAVRGASGWLTPWLVALGAVAVVAGGMLIWWRSRMTVDAAQPPSRPDEPV